MMRTSHATGDRLRARAACAHRVFVVVGVTWWAALSSCSDVLGLKRGERSGACVSQSDCAPNERCSLGQCVTTDCVHGEKQCDLLMRQACTDGHWHDVGVVCTERCAEGECAPARSCQFASKCGEREDYSCCQSDGIEAGTFMLPDDRSVERVDGPVQRSVSAFTLDRFEVTVGRFRNFLLAYDDVDLPKADAGAHPNIPGSGWQQAWNERRLLPRSSQALGATLTGCGQQIDGSIDDNLPVRCINWYTAFAFCIWDGGRLPTEAEWSYAAMGGADQRLYPWSSSDQAMEISQELACYSEDRWEDEANEKSGPALVAAHTRGASKFGPEDMAGNVWEWVADGYRSELRRGRCREVDGEGREATLDCEELEAPDKRVQKGGAYINGADTLKNRTRSFAPPEERDLTYGFRCARSSE